MFVINNSQQSHLNNQHRSVSSHSSNLSPVNNTSQSPATEPPQVLKEDQESHCLKSPLSRSNSNTSCTAVKSEAASNLANSPVQDFKHTATNSVDNRIQSPASRQETADCVDYQIDSDVEGQSLNTYDIKNLVNDSAVIEDPKSVIFEDLSPTPNRVRTNSAVDSPIVNVTTLSPYYKESSIPVEEEIEEDEEEEEEDEEESLKVEVDDCEPSQGGHSVSVFSTSALLNRTGSSAFSHPSLFSGSRTLASSPPPPLVAPSGDSNNLSYSSGQYQSSGGSSSCSFAPNSSGLFGLGSSKHLLMPTVSPLANNSSSACGSGNSSGSTFNQSSAGPFQYPTGSANSVVSASSSGTVSNPAELDQYLSAFFATTSSSAPGSQSVSQSLAQSQYAAGAASQFDSYLASQRQLPSAASAYPGSSSFVKNSVNSFLSPSLHSPSLFPQPNSLSSPYQQNVNRSDTASPQSSVGSPPTLTPLAPLNPAAAFLHHPAHRQFSSFSIPNGNCSSGGSANQNLESGSSSGSVAASEPSSTLHHHPSLTSATGASKPFDNCFASPSCLYYLNSHHTSRQAITSGVSATSPAASSGAIKRPFLNGLYSQSKRFSASISESSSGDDSGFVSTGSPATDTFPSPHSSPPQLIPPPPPTVGLTKSGSVSSNSASKQSVLNLGITSNSSGSSPSVTSAPMSASPTLPGGQYGHLGDAAAAATTAAYNFDDYSALPFSAINSGWSITNLDQATAAAAVAAAVSQSPTLHHATHPGLSLQAAVAPLQQGSIQAAAAAQPSPTSHLTASSHPTHGHQGSVMMLKDIKLFSNYPAKSAITSAELRIIKQPETHHRARYMTEGSRGTIKDRTGRGYPVVQLIGYNKTPVKLQCFIGHDQKIGEPHLFYQACEVSGKTPYTFVKVDGFNTIELELLPKNNMQAVFDCMGILKERNVDVERKVLRNRRKSASSHRPGVNATEEAKMIRNTNKSRSTHCRMVFRIILPETGEILQSVSDPILCTQPLGSPEIYKMSLREADLKGGVELFIIGKNFHKDSKVIFECQATHWRKVIVPQKEFLNSTHLVCQVPAYDGLNAQCLPLVNVDVSVHCNHKNSDPMKFIYTNGFTTSSVTSNGSMNSQSSAAVAAAAAYASVCTLRETTTVVANPIVTGSNANALFLLERNDVLK